MPANALPAQPGPWVCLVSIVLCGLTAGMAWAFADVMTRFDVRPVILPLAIGVGLFLRWLRIRGTRAAVCAVLAMLIAFAYAQYLFAAARIARQMGLPLRDVFTRAGTDLTASIAWGNVHMADLALLALAMAIAIATVTFRRAAPAPRTGTP